MTLVGLSLSDGRIIYAAQPKQAELHTAPEKYVLYGGAAGGGKSHALRQHGFMACLEHPNLPVLLLRRKLTELESTHIMRLRDLPAALGTYHAQGKRFDFPNGAWMKFGYCDNAADFSQYLSTEWGLILVDEAGQFDPWELTMLRSRLRVPSNVPGYDTIPTQIVYATNPGGPSHQYLYDLFIAKTGPRDGSHGYVAAEHHFIAARVTDNAYVTDDYIAELAKLPPLERKMYLDGSWDLPLGNLLGELSPHHHLVPARPRHPAYSRVVAADWGWAAPAPAVWIETDQGLRGALRSHLYQEWVPKETVPVQWAEGILTRSAVTDTAGRVTGYDIDAVILDSAAWSRGQDGSPSVAEQMMPTLRAARVKLLPAQKGPDSVRNSLALLHTYLWTADGTQPPLLTFSNACPETWEALVTIQRGDPTRKQDPDLPAPHQHQQHLLDAVRYWAMSRPKPALITVHGRLKADTELAKLEADSLSYAVAVQGRIARAAESHRPNPDRAAIKPLKQRRNPWSK